MNKEERVLMHVNPTEEYIEILGNRIYGYDSFEKFQEQLKIYDSLQQRIDKAIKYIKENTRYYDSEYSKIYGCLCDMAGAGDTRTHVILGDEELLKILKGDN